MAEDFSKREKLENLYTALDDDFKDELLGYIIDVVLPQWHEFNNSDINFHPAPPSIN